MKMNLSNSSQFVWIQTQIIVQTSKEKERIKNETFKYIYIYIRG